MARTPSPDQLEALIALQRRVLSGEVAEAQGLGPLTGFHIANGSWKPDGTAQVRVALRTVLKLWSDPAEAGAFQHGRAPDTAVQALEAHWGISSPPSTLTKAGQLVGVKGKTVAAWQRRFVTSAVVAAWFAQHPYTAEPASPPSQPRPIHEVAWRAWPHDGDRAELFARIREFEIGLHFDDEGLTHALRQVVERLAVKYLKHESSSRLGRTIAGQILTTWAVQDPHRLSPPELDSAKPDGGMKPAATAVLQMLAFEAVGASGRALDEELSARRLYRTSLEAVRARDVRSLTGLKPDQQAAVRSMLSNKQLEKPTDKERKATEFSRVDVLLASRALEHAEMIRVASEELLPGLIDHYLDLREQGKSRSPRVDPGLDALRLDQEQDAAVRAALFSLADQVVRLKAVDTRNVAQFQRFDRLREESAGVADYPFLRHRDHSLLKNKRRQYRTGIAGLLETERELVQRVGVSRRAVVPRLEQIQQLQLSIAGAFTSLLEHHLKVTASPAGIATALAGHAESALHFSQQCLVTLDDIVRKSDGALARRQSSQRRTIAWFGWFETAHRQRLRTLIAVRTASVAGMLPSVASTSQLQEFRIDALHREYRSMILLSQPSPGAESNLGMQGTWLAMLDGLRVPFEPEANELLVALPFLDRDPELAGHERYTTLNVEQSAQWHLLRGDPGNLGRIKPGTLAWRALDRLSAGHYARWRELLAGGDPRLVQDPGSVPAVVYLS